MQGQLRSDLKKDFGLWIWEDGSPVVALSCGSLRSSGSILPDEDLAIGDGCTAAVLEPKCSGAAEALECNFGLWDQEDGSLAVTLS